MPVTLADIDASLASTGPLLHADQELAREVAAARCDWLLDMRLQLAKPPIAPEPEPLDHGTD
jgi:hypothetical protein